MMSQIGLQRFYQPNDFLSTSAIPPRLDDFSLFPSQARACQIPVVSGGSVSPVSVARNVLGLKLNVF